MRRVNEAVREVISEAVGELKDPRVGLRDRDRSRDLDRPPPRDGLRRACSGRSASANARWPGSTAAHGLLQARVARELRMKRTPQLTFEYDPTVERGVRMTQLIDELAPSR